MLSPAETNLKLYSLLVEDLKLKGVKNKPKKHINTILDFVLEIDQLTGCMLIMLLECGTVSQMVCDNEKKGDKLLIHIVRKFISVHKLENVYKIIYTRYKDCLEMLPRELQDRFHRCTEYHNAKGGN